MDRQISCRRERDKTTTLSSVEGEKTAPAAICPPVTTEFNANGCKHYKRRCRIIARVAVKRLRADFVPHDGDHTVNRTAISEMVCNVCDTRQPVSNECTKCGAEMASYYCNVCHLFDGSGNDIYHCPFCNVCRRGKGHRIDFSLHEV